MSANNPQLRRYYRDIRRWLPCGRKQKQQIMEQIRNDVQVYFGQNPTSDFAQLQQALGDPLTITAAYVENMGTLELLKSLRIRRRIVTLVTAAVTVMLLLWVGVVTWAVLNEIDSTAAPYIEVTIE